MPLLGALLQPRIDGLTPNPFARLAAGLLPAGHGLKRPPPGGGPPAAKRPAGAGGSQQRRVFIRNLAFQATEQQVGEFFGAVGEVAEVRLLMGNDGRPRGMGVVSFKDPEAAARAVAELDGMELAGRKCFVKFDGEVRSPLLPPPGTQTQHPTPVWFA